MQTPDQVLEEKGVTPEDIEDMLDELQEHVESIDMANGVAAFEIDYENWLKEHKRHIFELRSALESQKTDGELRILVETSVSHYFDIFCMKAAAAKTYIFYLMSGMWKSPAERFLLVRRVRPSDLLKNLMELGVEKLVLPDVPNILNT